MLTGALLLAAAAPLAAWQEPEARRAGATIHDAYAPALERAAAQGADLLLLFTGSDWCRPCIEFEERVFADEAFLRESARTFVIARLDYPRFPEARKLVPDPESNEALAAGLGVTAFPTVILATADGQPYARTGSVPGTAAQYLEHLDDLRRRAAAARARIERLLATAVPEEERDDRVRAAAAMFRSIPPELVVRGRLLPEVRTGLDSDDEGLVTDCLRLLLEARAATGAEEELALRRDPENRRGLFEEVVDARLARTAFVEDMAAWCELAEHWAGLGRYHDPDRACRLLVAAAKFYFHYLARPQRARMMAERARDLGGIAPEDEPFIRKMLGA